MQITRFTAVLVLLINFHLCENKRVDGQDHVNPGSTNRPVIIAHRGASGYLPEHTEGAIVLAHAQGADYIEQDVVFSRDHVPIVCHDITLESISNIAQIFPQRAREDGRFYAIDFDLAELKQITLIERINPRTGELALPGRFSAQFGSRILTLAEDIALVKGLNQTLGRVAGIYPEIKRGAWHAEQTEKSLGTAVWDICRQAGYKSKEDHCYIQSFEAQDLVELRNQGCQLKLIQLLGSAPTNSDPHDQLAWAQEIAKYADGIGPAIHLIIDRDGKPTGIADAAREAGLAIHPYTVRNDALPSWASDPISVFDKLVVECGVDGFFTDHPDTYVAANKARFDKETK